MNSTGLSPRREPSTSVDERLDPEERLLLRCVRDHLDTARDDAADPSALDVDWEGFEETASRHHLRPPVYRVLLDDHAAAVPDDVADRWRSTVQQIAQRNLYLTGELLAVLDEFDDRGVRALPFKGPVLAAMAYGNVALREFADLDVVIDDAGYDRAKSVLRDRGYEIRHKTLTADRLTPTQEALILEYGRECEFVRDSDQLWVDLHWRFLPRRSTFPLSFTEANGRRESVTVAGGTLPSMSTADTLLLLAVHGTRHCWRHLRETCDLAALVRARDVDWQTVVRRAEAMGCRRRLGVGLQLARDLLGLSVPDQVVARVVDADPAVDSLVRGARDRLFGPETKSPSSTLGYKYAAHERRRDRLSFLLKWGFYPQRKEIESVALPASLSGLYHGLRPVRLLSDGYRRLF